MVLFLLLVDEARSGLVQEFQKGEKKHRGSRDLRAAVVEGRPALLVEVTYIDGGGRWWAGTGDRGVTVCSDAMW